eukprot:3637646-Rhodomonas_salina.1
MAQCSRPASACGTACVTTTHRAIIVHAHVQAADACVASGVWLCCGLSCGLSRGPASAPPSDHTAPGPALRLTSHLLLSASQHRLFSDYCAHAPC